MSGTITMYLGPMFSGKTSTMLSLLSKYNDLGLKTVLIRPEIDERILSSLSHSAIIDTSNINIEIIVSNTIKELKLDKYDCIGIDEGQFFKDLNTSHNLACNGKTILISCLKSNYLNEMFDSVVATIPFCDKIISLKSACKTCIKEKNNKFSSGIFTVRISNDEEIIVIGGSEKYEPRCRKHLI